MWYSVRPEILHLVSTSGVSAFFYTSSITAEHVCLFGRYSQEGWWTLCTYFKMCIIVLWGTAEDNLRLDGRAGIQRVLSALSDQLAEGNGMWMICLLASLCQPLLSSVTVFSSLCRREILPLQTKPRSGGSYRLDWGGWKSSSFVAEIKTPVAFRNTSPTISPHEQQSRWHIEIITSLFLI